MIPDEMKDLAETIARECKTFDDLLYKIRVVRTRPYSRLVAIISAAQHYLTVKDYCDGKGEKELVEYVGKLGLCGRKLITIYRGGSDIRVGDWVALDPKIAKWYAERYNTPIYSRQVPPEDVVWAGTDPTEWFYIPKHLAGKFSNLREFWDAVQRSLMAL